MCGFRGSAAGALAKVTQQRFVCGFSRTQHLALEIN